MSRLAARHVDDLQRALLALYAHRDLESFREATPGLVLSLIPGTYFVVRDARIDRTRKLARVVNLWESPPLLANGLQSALERNLPDHPFARHARRHGDTGALRLSDFLSARELHRTPLYREVLGPANTGHILSVGVFGGPFMSTLTVGRPESQPDFSERDRTMLNLLRPHFDLARANLERETQSRATRSGSLSARGLTPRETEVALWLAQGKTNAEIATILGAPTRTIEKHVERILRKMGAENRSTAALAVRRIVRA